MMLAKKSAAVKRDYNTYLSKRAESFLSLFFHSYLVERTGESLISRGAQSRHETP